MIKSRKHETIQAEMLLKVSRGGAIDAQENVLGMFGIVMCFILLPFCIFRRP